MIISIMLSLVIFISLSGNTCFASYEEEAADALNSLGLFSGSEAGYELERTPTRAEALVMLLRLTGQADAALAEIFRIPVGTPLLNMDEVDYDIDGNPVFCSMEYFADGYFRHAVMRKKL